MPFFSRPTPRLAAWGCALALVLGGCARMPPEQPPPRTRVRFTSGTPGAGFYALGEDLAREYARVLPGVEMEVRQSDGTASNLEAIQQGDADIGLTHADATYLAFAGRLAGTPRRFDRLRGVAVLPLNQVHIVIRPGAGISRVADLRGRRISLGRPSRESTSTAALVLKALGIGLNDVIVEPLRYDEAAKRLADGTLDALLVTGTYPLEAVTFATRAGARILPLDGPVVERLRQEYPFFRPVAIPARTYPGQAAAVHTLGVHTLVVCRAGLDERLVHDLTAELFEILPELPSIRSSLGLMDLDQASATPIPLHEGAARYYRERELSR
jgi:TRAP transporter TAXI family solute receptor